MSAILGLGFTANNKGIVLPEWICKGKTTLETQSENSNPSAKTNERTLEEEKRANNSVSPYDESTLYEIIESQCDEDETREVLKLLKKNMIQVKELLTNEEKFTPELSQMYEMLSFPF